MLGAVLEDHFRNYHLLSNDRNRRSAGRAVVSPRSLPSLKKVSVIHWPVSRCEALAVRRRSSSLLDHGWHRKLGS